MANRFFSRWALDLGYTVWYFEFAFGVTKSNFKFSHIDKDAGQVKGDYTSYSTEGWGPHARVYFTPTQVPGGLLGIAGDYYLISNSGYKKKSLTSSVLTESQVSGGYTMAVSSIMAVYLMRFK